jgi:hypothetical protein
VHLGVNSGKDDAALAAVALLDARLLSTAGGLSAGQALELLLTAVDRHQDHHSQHSFPSKSVLGSIVHSLRNSRSLDAVSAAQLMPVLQRAVQLDATALRSETPPTASKRESRISVMIRQPAFEQLKPEQLAALLEVVVEADDAYNFTMLTKPFPGELYSPEWPAFRQLDAATLASLMMVAIKVAAQGHSTEPTILRSLWSSQAGRQLREDGCQPALPVLLAAFSAWPAVNFGVGSMFKTMLYSASGSIGSTVLLELLTAALQAGNQQAFDFLWMLNGRESLSSVALGQLLHIASESGTNIFISVTRLLRGHPAWDAGCNATADKLFAQQVAAGRFLIGDSNMSWQLMRSCASAVP